MPQSTHKDSNNNSCEAKPQQKNHNILQGWDATLEMKDFLEYVSLIYNHAYSEHQIKLFFELLKPVWFYWFPVILLDGFDNDEDVIYHNHQLYHEYKTFTGSQARDPCIVSNYFWLINIFYIACSANVMLLFYLAWPRLERLEVWQLEESACCFSWSWSPSKLKFWSASYSWFEIGSAEEQVPQVCLQPWTLFMESLVMTPEERAAKLSPEEMWQYGISQIEKFLFISCKFRELPDMEGFPLFYPQSLYSIEQLELYLLFVYLALLMHMVCSFVLSTTCQY